MSGELTLRTSLSFNKSDAKVNRADGISVDVTGDAFTDGVQEIGTSEEEVVQGADVGTPGYVWMKNLDATNYVEVGSTTGVYDIKLKAKQIALWPHNSATIYAKANTAACNIQYIIIEL
uniref:Uncharacterized protein n=2 Tax=viral metagenome TaxID=1070528 RepID=A0A6M3K0G2_9ZZZZ